MLTSLARAAALGLTLLSLSAQMATAGSLAEFNAAVEAAESHNRVAIGYLRTGNDDLASIELDEMRAAWSKVIAEKRPQQFEGNALYATTLTDVSTRLVAADLMLKSGRLEAARQSLEGVRGDLYALRKSAHIVVLADCIFESNKAAAAFMAYDTPKLDLSKPDVGQAVAAKAADYVRVLDRCSATASEAVRNDPEYRRLIEEAKSELAKVPEAVKNHDSHQLHRIGGSLRAIDNLLTFRFG